MERTQVISHSNKTKSSLYSPTCHKCSDTGFVVVGGGAIRCDCCKKKETPNPASASPSAVATCSVPPNRAKTQRARMVARMEAAGPRGVTNREFIEMGCFRYSSRLHEIRASREVATIPVRGGLFRYVIKEGPRPLPACDSKKSTDTTLPLFAEARR